ncbi:ADP-ribosylglycohydrolase family protein [Streptomyces sp. IB2014 016-6]|uniref:ADP-ribosylglycohydrolase family protein n=1 Tax=Streptomyces sp. IB2014 016-6 TaxID=2517818 RepID=UPI0011C8F8DD|nr:ADP-ribosylglycohydrolase family protein [Streptomyces sp. IB2014 016-6]TXL92603.1 ADP-ribosylglycohydrolase family protein [Streptomyces sp. IB2014 016-6]
MTERLRVTWVQPEDLLGHELRQASEDGRDATAQAATWRASGGRPSPPRAGASTPPAPPTLRALALALLDELAELPGRLADREPTPLAEITQACGDDWPAARCGPESQRPAGPPPAGSGNHASLITAPQTSAGTSQAPWAPAGSGNQAPPTTAPRNDPHDPLNAATPAPPRAGASAPRPPEAPEPAGSDAHPPPGPAPHAPDGAGVSWGSGGSPPVSGRGGAGAQTPLSTHQSHAAWLGRAAGCLLGRPVEKLPLHAIRALARATGNWPLNTWFTAGGVPADLAAAHPWNRRSAVNSLAENIDGMPEDDDLNYPLLNVLLLQRYGRDFRTCDVALLWLDELPAGRAFTAERVAYRNLLSGIEPPGTARHHNPFREWIGAAIRADVHGWTHPGDPASAAAQAYRDATLTHTANGVYGAMFVAGTIAAAGVGGADVHASLRAGLSVVPPRSRLARAVRDAIQLARTHTDFDTVVDQLHAAHGHYHWVHAVPNAALLAAALTHADGDFTGSICRAVSGGWDTDSNGATAGSVAGLLAGHPDRLPERWTAPLKNRLATSVVGFDGIGFDELARLTQEALRP